MERIDYKRSRATQRPEQPEPLLLLGGAALFWITHLVCEACIGYFVFKAGGSRRFQEDWVFSTVVDAFYALLGAVVFAVVPFAIWCTGWMQLRRRVAGISASCGVAFCVSRWGLWYLITAKGYQYERPPVELLVASFLAALLSVTLLKDERLSE